MTEPISEYFAALERLKKRKAKINQDAVALEAGRKKGSIKKSRPQFADLILAIEAAAKVVTKEETLDARLKQLRDENNDLKRLLDESIEREVALAHQYFQLMVKTGEQLKGTVIPIRPKKK